MFGKQRKGWIGVDVGTAAVKLAQVVRVDGRVRVAQTAVIPRRIPWPDEQSGQESIPVGSRAEIHAAFQCGDSFRGRHAAAALPMHIYDFRGLHLPAGSDAERRTMIASELAEKWSLFDGGCEFDFWETELPGVKLRPDEANVNILAISNGWAQQLTSDVSQSGLQCMTIDGPPVALARAVALLEPPRRGERIAIVDWGFNNTTFSVMADSRPVFVRRIRGCGLRTVLEAVRESLGVTADQAQHLLETSGLPDRKHEDPDGQALAQAIVDGAAEPLRNLVRQLNRTLAYFDAQRRTLVPTKIVLTGGGAAIRNVDRFLGERLELPIAAWQLPSSEETAGEENGPLTSPLFASAVGLSILSLAA